jgi:hypothetical protein
MAKRSLVFYSQRTRAVNDLELTLTNFKPHSSGNHQHPYLPGIGNPQSVFQPILSFFLGLPVR